LDHVRYERVGQGGYDQACELFEDAVEVERLAENVTGFGEDGGALT
jgi:hypothetical protein